MSSKALLAAAVAALVLTASCEFPFSLRDSEEPTGVSTQLIPTTRPLDVRSNIWRSINNGDAISYGSQLAGAFAFTPDPIDQAALEQTYPGAFADWTADVERSVMEYALDPVRCSLSILSLSDSTVLEETETSYSIRYTYSVIFIIDDEFQAYAGQARLMMIKKPDDNLWYLEKWEDIRVEGSEKETWGILKGRIRATK
jgi:hypothetical protein